MNAAELKQFVRDTLVAPRDITQEISVLDAVVDFVSQSDTSDIPTWSDVLTFNSDGTGAGAFSTFLDSNSVVRLWKSKTMANTNNEPPEDPLVTENTYWIEVSPATGSSIKEWTPGVFGSGLVIVYHDLSGVGTDPALFVLQEATRPFDSSDFVTEHAAGKWARVCNEIKVAKVTVSSAELLACYTTAKDLVPAPGSNKYIEPISLEYYYKYNSAAYTVPGGIWIGHGTSPSGTNHHTGGIDITGILDMLCKLNLDNQATFSPSTKINKSLSLGASIGNPTVGDGTLTIFITYKINSII